MKKILLLAALSVAVCLQGGSLERTVKKYERQAAKLERKGAKLQYKNRQLEYKGQTLYPAAKRSYTRLAKGCR